MTYTNFQYKGGTLGQGCYINVFATRPDFFHCRLPTLITVCLMDLGRWQLIHFTEDNYRDETMTQQSWRVDNALSALAAERQRLHDAGGEKDWLLPLSTVVECYWRAGREQREQAILRLEQKTDDKLSLRLARVIAQLPNNTQPADAVTDE